MEEMYPNRKTRRAGAGRRLRTAICLALVLGVISAGGATGRAVAGPVERYPGLPVGGFTSDNVEWVKNLAIPGAVQTGTKVGDYFFVTVDALGLLIFDVSDPLDPVQVGHQPLPHVTENESVATNGDLVVMTSGGTLLYGGEQNGGALFVIDTSDKTDPHIIGSLPFAGEHTYECILDCTWAYGGLGAIVDLRDPTNPTLMEQTWHRDLNLGLFAGHDVTEVKPGYVLTSTNPMYYLDVNDPLNPVVLAGSDGRTTGSQHNVLWPNAGKDKLVLSAHEFGLAGNGTCGINEELDRQTNQEVVVRAWDASDWEKTHTFVGLGKWRPKNGNLEDGDPPVSGFGFSQCSTHYFDPHPKWRHGGLLAEAAYGHGLKFLEVSKDGQFEQVGFFLGAETGAQGAYWMSDDIVYVTDVHRGIDIVRFNGPSDPPAKAPQRAI